jgi:hypothetical protein
LKKSDSNSSFCFLQIKAIDEDVDPSFGSKSPCKESPGAASPASPVETPRKTKTTTKTTTTRTNTARSFDEKEQVSKFKVSQTANFD